MLIPRRSRDADRFMVDQLTQSWECMAAMGVLLDQANDHLTAMTSDRLRTAPALGVLVTVKLYGGAPTVLRAVVDMLGVTMAAKLYVADESTKLPAVAFGLGVVTVAKLAVIDEAIKLVAVRPGVGLTMAAKLTKLTP